MAKKKTNFDRFKDEYLSTGTVSGDSFSDFVDTYKDSITPSSGGYVDKSYPASQSDRTRAKLLVNDVEDPTKDSRNIIEKTLNLPEDQNFIFDIFELLGRPQQALFGAVDSLQKGENVLEGAWKGLSGEKETSGGQLLRNMGIGNGDDVELFDPSTWGTDDVVGFLLDIFADPADLLIFPAAGKVASKVDDVADAVKGVSKATDAIQTASKVGDAVQTVNKTRQSLNDIVFNTAKNLGKKTVNLADNAVGNALKAVDASHGYKYVDDILTELPKTADNIARVNAKQPLYQMYSGVKNELSNALNQGAKRVNQLIRGRLNASDRLASEGTETSTAIAEKALRELESNIPAYQEDLRKVLKQFPEHYQSDRVASLLSDDSKVAKEAWLQLIGEGVEAQKRGSINQNMIKNLADPTNTDTKISDAIGLGYRSTNRVVPNTQENRDFLNFLADELEKNQLSNAKNTVRYDKLKKVLDARGVEKNADVQARKLYREMRNLPKNAKVDTAEAWQYIEQWMADSIRINGNYKDFSSLLPALREGAKTGTEHILNISENTLKEVDDFFDYLKGLGGEGITNFNKNKLRKLVESGTSYGSGNHTADFATYLLNRLDPAIAQIYNTPSDIANNVDRLFGKMQWIPEAGEDDHFVKNIMGDYTGFDAKGGRLDTYGAYYHTQVNPEAVSILKNVPEESVRSLFNNRVLNTMDNASVNEYLRNLTKEEWKIFAPSLSNEQIDNLMKVVNEKGFYNTNIRENIMDMARNLPKQMSSVGVKSDIVNGLGLENVNNQLLQQSEINKIDEQIRKLNVNNVADQPEIAKLTQQKNQLIRQLNNTQREAIFKPASGAPFGNTGFKVVNYSDIENALSYISKNSKTTYKDILGGLKKMAKTGDGKIAVNPMVYNLLNLNRDPKGSSSAILGLLEKVNNLFKRNKLLSPAYNIRNMTGNATNLYLAGIPANRIPGLLEDSFKDYDKAIKAINQMKEGVTYTSLPSELRKAYDSFNELRTYGFGDVLEQAQELAEATATTASKVQGMDTIGRTSETLRNQRGILGSIVKKTAEGYDWLNAKNLELNVLGDNISRLAMFKYAKDNPKYLSRMGFENAGQAVANALFDPSDLSDFEQNVLRKIIPFYTFTKKNLAFQMRNLFDNPTQYKRFIKVVDAMWGDTPDNDRASYYRDGLAIPTTENEDGSRNVLNLNVPFGDLIETIQDPLSSIVSSTAPLIRAPFELANNVNTFTGREISEFEGQESDVLNNLPFMQDNGIIDMLPPQIDNRYFDYLLGNFTGLDQPISVATDLSNVLSSGYNAMTGRGGSDAFFDALGDFTGVVGQNNPASAQLSREYAQMEQLEDYLKFLDQEGLSLQNVTDWEDTNQGKIGAQLQAQLDYLMGRKNPGQQEVRVGDAKFYIPTTQR